MKRDLVILTADVQQEKTLDVLLKERQTALGIHPIDYTILRHPRKDAGVYHEAHRFLKPYQTLYTHALVMLDREWSGSPGKTIRQQIRDRLEQAGWSHDNCEVIVVAPELEAWVWANSPIVAEELRLSWNAIHELAHRMGTWEGTIKPTRPKELLEAILRQQHRPRSAALFQALARRVGLKTCSDPAFVLLRDTLMRWFANTKDS